MRLSVSTAAAALLLSGAIAQDTTAPNAMHVTEFHASGLRNLNASHVSFLIDPDHPSAPGTYHCHATASTALSRIEDVKAPVKCDTTNTTSSNPAVALPDGTTATAQLSFTLAWSQEVSTAGRELVVDFELITSASAHVEETVVGRHVFLDWQFQWLAEDGTPSGQGSKVETYVGPMAFDIDDVTVS